MPPEMMDAARLDGAGESKIFIRVAVPLMVPALVTVFMLNFVAAWNNYFLPFIINNSARLYTLTQGLAIWMNHTNIAGSSEDFTALTITAGHDHDHATDHHVPGPSALLAQRLAAGRHDRLATGPLRRRPFPARRKRSVTSRLGPPAGSGRSGYRVRGCPAMAESSASAAMRPTSGKFMSTVVRGGWAASAMTVQLSKPTSAMSSGTRTPDSRRASATPRATWSLPQKTASVLGAARRRIRAAWRPQASLHSP